MAWDFETDAAFQEKLDWIETFTREEIEPLDQVVANPYLIDEPVRKALIPPLQQQVREKGLWALHLRPELGGQGFGQVQMALVNEIIGRTYAGPSVFGCQAPDSGNAEILAKYGTAAQKERFLQPLLDNEIVSCFSMTEPQGGSDPTQFRLRAELDGDEWVLNGEKWFSSGARYASFLITVAVTDPDAERHRRLSTFLVPADTPGLRIIRNVSLGVHGSYHDEAHTYLSYENVRLPADHLLGGRGDGFVVTQTRLGGGRMHHAMRAVALMKRALDMIGERVLSRTTQGSLLADKQLVQEKIARCWIEIETFRLLVLQTAWKIDRYDDYLKVRKDIAAVKALMPEVVHNVANRALQLHGSLGLSDELSIVDLVMESYHLGLADGPTDIHLLTVARQVLRDYKATDDLFPTMHQPKLKTQALAKYADVLEQIELERAVGDAAPAAT
jgi:acyl-CoA dehydrogenase